jgi:hypothetical protein
VSAVGSAGERVGEPAARRPIRRVGAVALAAALPIACILHAPACKNDGTHVYVGQLYVEARHCLGTGSAVDVVTGDDPGQCAPICIHQNRSVGGHAIYVATMCPPYPGPDFDTSGTDPLCTPALAALARGDTCFSDGGSSHPLVDAGAAD